MIINEFVKPRISKPSLSLFISLSVPPISKPSFNRSSTKLQKGPSLDAARYRMLSVFALQLRRRTANDSNCLSFFCDSVQAAIDWAVPQSSRLKYRQLFNSHDKMMSGHLTGTQTSTTFFYFIFFKNSSIIFIFISATPPSFCLIQVPKLEQSWCSPVFLKASWPQSGQYIETIQVLFSKNVTHKVHDIPLSFFRSLSDIDQDGKLTAEEFILAMHLIDMAMSGLPLPPVLPPDYIPPTFRWTKYTKYTEH